MDKGSCNAGVHRGLSRSASCTPERSTTPTWPHRYIAQLGILSYKGGYKERREISPGLFGVVCTSWLAPGNPVAPLGWNSNDDIHSTTRLN